MKPALILKTQQFLADPALQAVMKALGADRSRLVGGAVRAAILGEAQGDIDIATMLTPPESTAALEKAGIKVVPTGIDHGTVTAVIDKRGFEITTLRRDVETDGRRAVVAFTKDWGEDAQRRDFTMNTLLMDLNGNVYDPTGHGVDDLKNGVVRFVGDAQTRIAEDALRILRFFRFHSRYGKGKPDVTGYDACVHNRHLIENLSRERITQEIEKLLPAKLAGSSIMGMIKGKILDGLWQANFDEGRYDLLRQIAINASMPQKEMLLFAYSVYQNNLENLHAKLEKYFVFSNIKKVFLNSIIGFVSKQSDSLAGNLYLFGRDVTLAGSVLSNTINAKSITLSALEALVEEVRETPVPVFPITARDLMATLGMREGRSLGEVMKKTESWWLEKESAGVKIDRDACLDYAKTLL